MDLVLYVNADRGAMRDASNLFQGARFRVAATGSLSKALEYARTGAPDAIVVSLGSDSRDILGFVRNIRVDAGSRHIPVLALTDLSGGQEKQRLGEAGITATMSKAETSALVPKLRELIAAESNAKRTAADTREVHILVETQGGQTFIRFKSSIRKHILPQIRPTFTTDLLNRVAKTRICFDLRPVPEMDVSEATIIEKLLPIFSSRVAVIAGRHMGTLLSSGDLFEKSDVFLSMDEYIEFLRLSQGLPKA